ncbi:transglycosylase SLT domain-containing protein [Endothiovibrio diazotrophicus]
MKRFLGLLALLFAPVVHATAEIPPAYHAVAAERGVPAQLLYSVALVESQRPVAGGRRPWPWTLNVEGRSLFFPSREAALRALVQALAHTDRVAVGLMQVYWRYNGHRFGGDPQRALDPYANLRAGADVLRECIARKRSLGAGIGCYNATSPDKAARYLAKVTTELRALREGG